MRILYLAAVSGEQLVEQALSELPDGGERFDADRVRHTVRPERPIVPMVTIGAPDLKVHDALLAEAVRTQLEASGRCGGKRDHQPLRTTRSSVPHPE